MIDYKCVGCGAKLEVADEAAGTKIKCPDCGAIGEIPGKDLPPLAFACNNCGQDLQISAYQAGRLTACPHCGCMVMVPPLSGQSGTDKEGCLGIIACLVLLVTTSILLIA